jgi:prefoldin subunit 5
MAAKNKVIIEVDAKDSTAPTLRNLNNNLKKTAEHGKKVDKQFRMIRGGMGQMGHQVQDVAVMLQSGQNPLIILGQQGSQVASLFGPQGAIVGAFLAVGAAIGTSMLPAFFKASEATKELKEANEDLISSFDDLGNAQKAYAKTMAVKKILEHQEAIDELNETDRRRGVTLAKGFLAQREYNESLEDYKERIQKLNSDLAFHQKRIDEITSATDGTTDETEKLIESLTAEASVLGMTETAQVRLTDAYRDASEPNKKIIDQQRQKIDQYNELVAAMQAEQTALDAAFKEDQKRAAQTDKQKEADKKRTETQLDGLKTGLMNRAELIEHAYNKEAAIIQNAQDHGLISAKEHAALMGEVDKKRVEAHEQLTLTTASSLIGMTSSMISSMQGMVDQGSTMGKAFFLISQTLAAADAIVKGYQTSAAITLAYANMATQASMVPGLAAAVPGILAAGKAHSAMAVGMGFATAGMIAGQTLASFEGGGLTGSGVRSGGMDGKGGRLAMVHPNEKITDLHKGQGESKVVNVNFTIQANDTAGFDRLLNSRRGQIVNIINQAVNDRGRPSVA